MQYVLLIYSNEEEEYAMTPEEQGPYLEAYGALSASLKSRGEMLGGEALQHTNTATAVRVREGKVLTTDGPFAETREALGGFYLVEAENLDRAIEIASQIPTAKHGTVEVRPIMRYE